MVALRKGWWAVGPVLEIAKFPTRTHNLHITLDQVSALGRSFFVQILGGNLSNYSYSSDLRLTHIETF